MTSYPYNNISQEERTNIKNEILSLIPSKYEPHLRILYHGSSTFLLLFSNNYLEGKSLQLVKKELQTIYLLYGTIFICDETKDIFLHLTNSNIHDKKIQKIQKTLSKIKEQIKKEKQRYLLIDLFQQKEEKMEELKEIQYLKDNHNLPLKPREMILK